MKKFMFLFICFLGCIFVESQSQEEIIQELYAIHVVAKNYMEEGKYQESLTKFEIIISKIKQLPQSDSLLIIEGNCYDIVAEIYKRQGLNKKIQLEYLIKSINTLNQVNSNLDEKSQIKKIYICNRVAGIYIDLSSFFAAREILERCLRSIKNLDTSKSAKLVYYLNLKRDIYNNLGQVHIELGSNLESVDCFKKAMEIPFLPNDPNMQIGKARLLNNQGRAFLNSGKLALAEDLLKEALTINEWKQNIDSEVTYNNLGVLYRLQMLKTKDAKLKQQLFKKAEDQYNRSSKKDYYFYNNIARLYQDFERYKEALDNYELAFNKTYELHGENHDSIVKIYANKARCKYLWKVRTKSSDYKGEKYKAIDDGLEDIQKAIEIAKGIYGSEVASLRSIKSLILASRSDSNAWIEALESFNSYVSTFSNEMVALSTEEKIARAEYFVAPISASLCALSYSDTNSIEKIRICFDRVMYYKNLIARVLLWEKEIQSLSNDPELHNLYMKYKDIVRNLTKSSYAIASPEQIKNIKKLEIQVTDLEAQLTSKSSKLFTSLKDTSFFKKSLLEDVQNQLHDNAVIWEFVSFMDYNDYKEKIGIFIIRKKSQEFIVLGDVETFEGAIETIRNTISEFRKDYTKGKVKVKDIKKEEKKLIKKLKVFSDLLNPVFSDLREKEFVYISPDNCLNYLSFAMLRVKESYLIQKHNFVYLSTSMDLLRKSDNFNKSRDKWRAYLVANPNYNDRSQTIDKTKRIRVIWRDLQGADIEIFALEQALESEKYNNLEDDLGEYATEENFAKHSSGRDWIHIVAHGIFIDKEKTDPSRYLSSYNIGLNYDSNPFLFSAIALTGANYFMKEVQNLSSNKGYLTALEILFLDLQECYCVFLSACETALGENISGIGISGFKLAFKHAGSKYMVMSLWQIPDRESGIIVSQFYDIYRRAFEEEKNNIAPWQALLASQRKYLHESKELSHPYFWAGFICQSNFFAHPEIVQIDGEVYSEP